MLLRFSFQNHRSFRDEQSFSMIASNYSDHPEVIRRVDGFADGVLPVAAIYGANASGKTNVFRALHFFQTAIQMSHRVWKPDGGIPLDTFLGQSSGSDASSYMIDFLLEGTRHHYGFTATADAIEREWLHVFPNGKRQIWYERSPGKRVKFGTKLPGAKQSIMGLTRSNSLFLSAAVQNAHAALGPVFKWLTSSLVVLPVGSMVRSALGGTSPRQVQEYKDQMDALLPMLRAADLGIEDVTFVDEQMRPETAELLGHIFEMIRRRSPGEEVPELPSSHQEVRFIHRGGATFKPDQESNGTLSFFALLGPGLRALRGGGTLCVDELDTSLHPSLAIQLVRLFQNPESNPKRAQLIFNTHDTNLLNHAGLRRDQIWFCEKARDGATTLYPLSDFKARLGENLATGYLQGRYGAIPFLNEQVFAEVMALQNGKE